MSTNKVASRRMRIIPRFEVATKIGNVIRRFVQPRLYLIVLLIAGVIATYLELSPASLPLGGDNIIPAFNGIEIGRYLSAWNSWAELGSNVPQVLAGPPLTDASFLAFIQSVGFNIVQASWVYLCTFTAIGAMGTAYLFRTVFPKVRSSQVGSILSGLFFLFNPSLVVDTFKGLWLTLPERAFFPIFLALFIDGHQKRRMEYSLLSGAVCFVLLARFPVGSAEYLIAAGVFVCLYLGIVTVTAQPRKEVLSFSLRYLGLTALTTVAVNAYLVYAYLLNLQGYNSTLSSYSVNGFTENAWSSIWNVTRLLSFWGFYNGYVPYARTYASDLTVILSTIAIPLVGFATILICRSRRVLIVTAVAVAIIFFATGNYYPGGELYSQLVRLSIFKVFYISSLLIPFLALAYSLLFPHFYYEISLIARRYRQRIQVLVRSSLIVIMLAILLVASWPLITGSVASDYQNPSSRGVNVPPEYSSLQQWLISNGTSGRTMLGYYPTTYVTTRWGFQGSQQFYQNYLDTSLITGIGTQYSQPNPMVSYAYGLQHFMRLDPNDMVDLRNATSQLWTSYQSDSLSTSVSGFNSSSTMAWQIRPSPGGMHEISYSLQSVQNWANFSAISVWVNVPNLSAVQFGIEDSSRSVGWYYVTSHYSRTQLGWTEVILPLKVPDYSTFELSAVTSLLMQSPSDNLEYTIEISTIQYGGLIYDSSTWANFLGLLGIKWVLQDQSLTNVGWPDYSNFLDSNSFVAAFSQGSLTLYQDKLATSTIHSAKETINTNSIQGIADLIESGGVNINDSALVIGGSGLNFNGTVTLSTSDLSNEGPYHVNALSTGPFVLVFDQQYDPQWRLTDSNGSAFEHFEVNGYANAWRIPTGGLLNLTLSYAPQFGYIVNFWSSVMSVILATGLPIALTVYDRTLRKVEHSETAVEPASESRQDSGEDWRT